MWRRLIPRGRGAAAAGEPASAASASLEASEAAAAEIVAASALREWAAALEKTPLADSRLGKVVRLILAVPCGDERNALVSQLGSGLSTSPAALIGPGEPAEDGGEWFEPHLSLLRDCFDSKELQDAVVGIFEGLAADAGLAQFVADSTPREGEEAEPAALQLATALRRATSSQGAMQRCEELLRTRRLALHQAEMLLGAPQKAAEQRAEDANLEGSKIQDELAAAQARVGSDYIGNLEKEGVTFESEVNRLQDLKRDLRAELDRVNRQHEDALARQLAHMTQVDCWRFDKEKVKESAVKSREETVQEKETAQQKRQNCESFVAKLANMQEALKDVQAKDEEEARSRVEAADGHYSASAAGIVEATEVRLQAALRVATKLKEEHVRAKQTLELLEVEGSPNELPTRKELSRALVTLRDAWAARVTLGDVDLRRRGELEAFIREASEEGSASPTTAAPGETLADAKASWAQRWSELGDVCGLLADAAAGDAPRSAIVSDAQPDLGGSEQPMGAPSPAQVTLPSLDDDDDSLLG